MKRFRPFLVGAFALCFFAGSAKAIDIDRVSEAQRAKDNRARVAKMHPWVRPKINAVISDLEGHGWRPLIHGDVYRSPAKQAQLKNKGVSKVGYSFHMTTDKNARGSAVAAALAADIVDKRYGWSAGNNYWMMLARAAHSHQLTTGIYWGLSAGERQRLRNLIYARNFTAPYNRGWDAAHCEPQPEFVTLGEARQGKRPPVKRAKK